MAIVVAVVEAGGIRLGQGIAKHRRQAEEGYLPVIGKRGEFYTLLLFSTLGMNLMASSANMIMLFLAIETALEIKNVFLLFILIRKNIFSLNIFGNW